MERRKGRPLKPVPNDAKLRELILYIATKSEGDESFGAIKLNKLLFLIDFYTYVALEKAVTGQEYQALREGPAPKRILQIISDMKKAGEVAIRPQDFHEGRQQRPFALRKPNLSRFSSDEIDIVAEFIDRFWGKTPSEMSELSHQFISWQVAEEGETIPYSVALVGNREPTLEERRRGQLLQDYAREVRRKTYGDRR